MTTSLIPSIIDDQLAELGSYNTHIVVGKTPEAALRAAEGFGLDGWPRSSSRERRDGGPLWVHRYARPKEVRHA